MPVVLLIAALAILAGVVVVAIGRGGELAMFRPDIPARQQSFATAADVAAFRPPPAFFGYSAPATDEALHRIGRVVAERNAEVARLRDQVIRLGGEPWPGPGPYGQAEGRAADWAESQRWRGPGAYAEPERRAEPADWPSTRAYAEPEDRPEPADWRSPEAATEPEVRSEFAEPRSAEVYAGPDGPAEPSGWPPPGPDAAPADETDGGEPEARHL
jgi:hypothetical protein